MQIDGEATFSSIRATKYLVGAALDDAEAAGEALDIFWPFAYDSIRDWVQGEALWCVKMIPPGPFQPQVLYL